MKAHDMATAFEMVRIMIQAMHVRHGEQPETDEDRALILLDQDLATFQQYVAVHDKPPKFWYKIIQQAYTQYEDEVFCKICGVPCGELLCLHCADIEDLKYHEHSFDIDVPF